MKLNSSKHCISLAIILGIVSGCGGTRSDLATVSGTIMLDGEPLANAQVEFSPAGGAGSTSYGTTNESGVYTMMATRSAQGTATGNNTVRITTADVIEEDGEEVVIPEKLGPKYNTASELTADVQQGANTIDFLLVSSDKKIAQPNMLDE